MSEYFAAGRRKNLGVVTNDDFTLTISFDNGEKRMVNVSFLKLHSEDGDISSKGLFSLILIPSSKFLWVCHKPQARL